MPSALAELTHAVKTLTDGARVVELAVRAMHEACGRGAAFGSMLGVEGVPRPQGLCVYANGAPVSVTPSRLAMIRSPAIDITAVPAAQRNRWVEPFREGIATREG